MEHAKVKIRKGAGLLILLAGIVPAMTSCYKERFESKTIPDQIVWNPEVAFPLGEDRFGMDEFSGFDTTLLQLDTLTGLPQWVNELTLVLEGNIDFNLTSINENLDKLNRILFRINAYNGFPNEMSIQAYFMDGFQNPLDSMFMEGPLLLKPGTVQGSGETTDPSHTQKDAIFEKDRIQPLGIATEIFFRATLQVSQVDSTLVRFYPGYDLEISIGAMLDLTLQF